MDFTSNSDLPPLNPSRANLVARGDLLEDMDLFATTLTAEELPEALSGSCAGSFFCGGSFSSAGSCGSSISTSSSFSSATG